MPLTDEQIMYCSSNSKKNDRSTYRKGIQVNLDNVKIIESVFLYTSH